MKKKTIIIVNHVSKKYALHTKSTLRQTTSTWLKQKTRTKRRKSFYALRDINFRVAKGEGIAVVGINGSVKTTLLQLLSNIMSPTAGTIQVRGRYTSLLGANLGLMPTMTGLENIHLMAAMYGVNLSQEPELLGDIIAFADIGEFINSYAKDYSSGMRARIGFSVAIHCFPEIVFIDEVLAVGDIHFRNKCKRRMARLRKNGRTFVIATQNAQGLEELCDRGIWLHDGEIVLDGPLEDTWNRYQAFKQEKKIDRRYVE
jgi:ABC-type polysaccharide/polyol phosphate transport system ATPase subunit